MDISSRFSLVDFLAYFFPGVFGTLGIFSILYFTPLKSFLLEINLDVSLAILFFVFSYIIGVLISGISEIFFRKTFGGRNIRGLIFIPEYQKELQTAFFDVFCKGVKREENWSFTNFYLCRSLVMEFMPNIADFVNRQSSLRQFRLNLIPTLVLWMIAGILWGANLLTAQARDWGIAMIVGSIILACFFVFTLFNRMRSNEEREVREVQTAFLAGYKAGVFTNKGVPQA